MKSLHNSAVGDFTRGGQVTIHFLRMIMQVVQKFGLAALMLYSLITFGLWYGKTTDYQRYLGTRYVASLVGVYLENGNELVPIQMIDGREIQLTVSQLANSAKMRSNFNGMVRLWLHCMLHAAGIAGLILFCLFIWLYKFGRSQRSETHLRGGKLIDGQELAKLIRKRGLAGPIKFGGIPLVKDSETAHILMTGSSGTGKTTGFYELMVQVRRMNQRMVCYSPSGDFLSWFYRPGKDIILNLFDARTPSWDLWGECDQPYHYPMIAASLIPVPEKGEKIWSEAAQSLVAVLLRELHKRGNPTIEDLIRIVTMLPMSQIYEILKDTEVAANLDPSNEKMGASIRSTATIAMRSMTYLPTRQSAQFTFKEWVERENDDSWIFITARADQIDAARPVLSTWVEVFVSRMLSLSESRSRRIWLAIDELPSLNKLNSLPLFVEQARKFGGCGLLAFQQASQLYHIYGKEIGSSIIGQCNTWVCFRQNDPETAKFIGEKFGKVEIEENQQGLSYGANDMRDGVSLNQQRKDREVVMASEVMGLPNLAGYIKMVGDLPGGTFQLVRRTIKAVAPAYVAPSRDLVAEALSMSATEAIPLGDEDAILQASADAPLQYVPDDAPASGNGVATVSEEVPSAPPAAPAEPPPRPNPGSSNLPVDSLYEV